MTEKRFTLAYNENTWWAVRNGYITLWKEEVIDELNNQDRIIESQTKQLQKQHLKITELEKENKRLKKEQYGAIENDSYIECPKCGAIPEYWFYEDGKVSCPNCDMELDGDVE